MSVSVCVCLSVCPGVSVSVSVCVCLSVCPGVSVSMAGFLAAETLCDADVSESVVAREMHAAEHKQQQHAFNHHQSQGMSTTQHTCGGYLVLP